MFNYSDEEFRELGRQGVLDPKSPELSKKLKEREEKGRTSGEVIGIRRNGKRFWCEFSSTVFDDPGGDKIASLELIDMFGTQDKQESLKGVMNNIPGVIYRYTTKSDGFEKTEFVSGEVKQVLGFDPEDVFEDESLGWKNIHEDDVDRVIRSMNESAEKNKKWVCEYRYHHPDGTMRWLRGMAKPVHKKDERVVWDSIVIDITEEKQAEISLKLMESVVTEANDAVLITKAEPVEAPEGPEIVYVNRSFEKMTDYAAQDVIGKTPRILQGPDTGSEQLQELRNAIRNRESVEVELLNYSKQGEEYWVNISLSPIFEGNKCTHFISIQKDITDRKLGEIQKSLSSEISLIFNREETVWKALQSSLDEIANLKFFDAIEFWLVDRDRRLMNLAAHTIGSSAIADFYTDVKKIKPFKKGEGLPGETWKKKEGLFWKNVDIRKTFVRNKAAAKVGLKTAFSFPVTDEGEVLGVLVLLTSEDMKRERYYVELFNELSKQFASEIKRKQLEEELSRIFKSAPDVICVAGLDGYYKKVNPAMSELLGYSEEELLNTPIIEFVHPADKQKTQDEFLALNRGKGNHYFENRYITKSGKVIWLSWTTKPFYDEGITYSVAKDVTEEKELRELLDQANRLAKIGSWELDAINGEIYWSDITREIHETEPDFSPVLEEGINFYKEGESREVITEAVKQAMENGTPWDHELQIVTAKGNEKWIRTIGEAEIVDGKCVRVYGSFQDIHESKSNEIALEQSLKTLQDYRFALDQAASFTITDANGVITSVNDKFCQLSQYYKEELIGKTHRIINSRYHPKSFFSDFWETINSGNVWRGEVKNRKKDGTFYWVDTTVVPFLDENNQPFQFLAFRVDITEKKLAQEKISKALEEKNTILESISDAFYAIDEHWNITYFNSEAENQLDKKWENVVGNSIWDEFPAAKETELYTIYHEVMKQKEPQSFEYYYPPVDSWYDISAYPAENGISVYFKNINEKKEAQVHILEKTRQLDAIARFNALLIKEDDWLQALDKSLEQFGDVAGADRVYFFEHSILHETGQDAISIKAEWVSEGTTREIDNPKNQNHPFDDIQSFMDQVIHEGGFNKVVSEIEDKGVAEFVSGQQIKSLLALPVFTGKEFRGFIGFDDCVNERIWSEEEITFLKTIAINLGSAIENKISKERILKSESRLQGIIDSQTNYIIRTDLEGYYTYYNPKFKDEYGWIHGEDNLDGVHCMISIKEYHHDRVRQVVDQCMNNPKEVYQIEIDKPGKNGNIKTTLWDFVCLTDNVGKPTEIQCVGIDITEKKMSETELKESLREKEVLLAEVHHRVKNNLAVVSAMMQLQAYEEENELIAEKLNDSISRVHTMATIHEILYQSGSFSKLSFSKILEKLIESISSTMVQDKNIDVRFTPVPVELNINQAIPCALIVNEVITNVYKHAFKGRKTGILDVNLSIVNDLVDVEIKDNGVGLPKTFTSQDAKSLGIHLLKTLATQLEAEYNFNSSDKGTEFRLRFTKADIRGSGNAQLSGSEAP